MKYPKIKRLFKYYAYNVNSLSVLINGRMWYAKPDSLNDPFDCRIPFNSNINTQDLANFLPRYQKFKRITDKQLEEEMQKMLDPKGRLDKKYEKIWAVLLHEADEQLSNSGVFCLSQNSSNILMWSHYADGHKGFCVEFVRNSQNDLGDYEKTRRVQYRSDYPTVSPLSPDAFDLKFFTKAKDWKYEKEWRLINEEGNVEEALPVDISAIIFGLNMPAPQRETIKNILSERQEIEYRKAVRIENEFKMKITKEE